MSRLDLNEAMDPPITCTVKKSDHRVVWKVENFHQICPENCQEFPPMSSPPITAGVINGKKLQWCFKLNGENGKLAVYLQLLTSELECRSYGFVEVKCNFMMGVGNDRNPSVHFYNYEEVNYFSEQNGTSWGYDDFINISKLYRIRESLLENNVLRLYVKMKIYTDTTTTTPVIPSIDPVYGYELPSSPGSTITRSSGPPLKRKWKSAAALFSREFENLFESQSFSDVQLQCDTQSFHCHKAILSARSKVFAAMFDTAMRESKENLVVIQGIKPTTMSILLKYIYTGKIVEGDIVSGGGGGGGRQEPRDEEEDGEENGGFSLVDWEVWNELLSAADRYDLPEFKSHCFQKMFQTTSDHNVADLMVAAHAYNAETEVKEAVRDYCKANIGRLMENKAFRLSFAKHTEAFYEDCEEKDQKSESNG